MPPKKTNKRGLASEDPDQLLETDKLSEDGRLIVEALQEKLDAIQGQLEGVKNEFLEALTSKETRIEDLECEVRTLKMKLSRVEERVDDADAYERRDTLLITGDDVPVVRDGEVCCEVVRELIKDKLKLNIAQSDISTCHRLGRKSVSQRPDKRTIALKLCRRDLKKDIISACRQLRPKMFVNESLTPIRNTIMYGLRKAKRDHPDKISGCSSIDGRVMVWIKPLNESTPGARDTRMFVNSREKLELLCSDILKVPLESLVENWPW